MKLFCEQCNASTPLYCKCNEYKKYNDLLSRNKKMEAQLLRLKCYALTNWISVEMWDEMLEDLDIN